MQRIPKNLKNLIFLRDCSDKKFLSSGWRVSSSPAIGQWSSPMHLIGSSLKKEEIAGQRCCELDLTLGDALLSPIKMIIFFQIFLILLYHSNRLNVSVMYESSDDELHFGSINFQGIEIEFEKKINRINSNWKIHKPNLDF